jgi:hypothetical protein
MMWVAIFHLACLAITLELMHRAPEYDERAKAEPYRERARLAARRS